MGGDAARRVKFQSVARGTMPWQKRARGLVRPRWRFGLVGRSSLNSRCHNPELHACGANT